MRVLVILLLALPHIASQCTDVCTTCPGCLMSITTSSQCPNNSITLTDGATSILECTAVAGAYGINGEECTLCSAGTYSSGIGVTSSAACTSCLMGQYSTAQGATAPDTCFACPIGQYCTTLGSAPLNCTNKPIDSYYTSTATNATGCQWTCSPGYYQSSGACVSCPVGSWCFAGVQNTCPTNSISDELSSSQNQCLCKAGYFGDGSISGTSPCPACTAGSYCPGGNNNLTLACPVNSTSSVEAASLAQCYCPAGYFGSNGSVCALCPPNTLCESGNLTFCPANTNSPIGSSGLCTANAGFYQLSAGSDAIECPANSYCTGGTNIASCTANAVSPVQSSNSTACYCDRGYQGINNSPCVACKPGTWCWTGILNQCPAYSNSSALSSYMNNCTCNPGYSGPNGGPCVGCMQGQEKASQGNAPCTVCGPNSFAPAYCSITCTAVTLCPNGMYPSPAYTAITDNVCSPCPANSFCRNNTLIACPTPTVSQPNSTTHSQCRCPAGMFGKVTNATLAQCALCVSGQYCPADSSTCTC